MTKTEHAQGGWFGFSLRSLFLTILVVASFFAGRASMIPSIQQMHAEAEMQRAMAHKQRAMAEASAQQAIQAVDALLTQQSEQSPTVNDGLRQQLQRQSAESYDDLLNDDDR